MLQISAFFSDQSKTDCLLDVQSCVTLSLDQVEKVSKIFHQLIITTKIFGSEIFHSNGIVSHFFYLYVSRDISQGDMCL